MSGQEAQGRWKRGAPVIFFPNTEDQNQQNQPVFALWNENDV